MHSSSTRWGSVLLVMVLAPWFAEFSWGGYPLTYVPVALLFVGPMYGGAALLIREAAVRSHRGWPAILLLAAAFGVLQAGLVDQSLFNPAYGRYDFQQPAHVPGLDISLYFLVAFVSGHVVASIAAPLIIAGTWSRRPTEPWLGRGGLGLVGTLYVLSTIVNHLGVKNEEGDGFQASAFQMGAVVAAVTLLVGAALLRRSGGSLEIRAPAPWLLAVLGFAAYLLYLPGENTTSVVIGIVVITTAIATVGRWSRSTHWSSTHTFALAMGSVLVGTVAPFLVEPYDNTVSRNAQLAGAGAAAVVCATIVLASTRRHIRSRSSTHIKSRSSGGISKSPPPP